MLHVFAFCPVVQARWTAYNTAADFFRDDKGKLSMGANIMCGICAGTSEAIFAVTPIETLKSRVIDDMRQGTNKYVDVRS